MPSELTLRPASPEDLPAIAEVHLDARRGAGPAMPPPVHPDDECRDWVTGWDLDLPAREVWVAEDNRGIVGYTRVEGDWLDDLYVAPSAAREGIGSALLELVKGLRPDGFCLWVFESNEPALRFYERRGLLSLERTDGSANEEKAPDRRLAWPGAEPLTFLRSLIDEVDDSLAQLLARRAALTSAVQLQKEVPGEPGRDAARERAIADRMAHHAPALGSDRLARIVHTIISESLDADRARTAPQ